jgi:hypothetical protein
MALPKKNLDWGEAHSIFAENRGTPEQRAMLYRMAPTLALYQRGLENDKEQGPIIAQALASMAYIHQQSPTTAENTKRSFAITYLQTHVHARLLSAKQASDLIGYLEQKGVIAPDCPLPERLH